MPAGLKGAHSRKCLGPVELFQRIVAAALVYLLALAEMVPEVNAEIAGIHVLVEVIDIAVNIGLKLQALAFEDVDCIYSEVDLFVHEAFLYASIKTCSRRDLVKPIGGWPLVEEGQLEPEIGRQQNRMPRLQHVIQFVVHNVAAVDINGEFIVGDNGRVVHIPAPIL